MFYGCGSLSFLNINNFDTKKVTNMGDMFGGLKSLTSLNISNFQILENSIYNNIITGIAENLIFCVNDNFYKIIESEINEKNCSKRIINCTSEWGTTSSKIISETGKCIERCDLSDIYKYEYENKCYSSCPTGTTSLYNNNFLCEIFNEKKFLDMNIKTEEIKPNTEKIINEETNIKETDNKIIDNNNNLNIKVCQPEGFYIKECAPTKFD